MEYKLNEIHVEPELIHDRKAVLFESTRAWWLYKLEPTSVVVLTTSGWDGDDFYNTTHYFDSAASAIIFLNKTLKAEEDEAIQEAIESGVCPFCGRDLQDTQCSYCEKE